MSKLKRVIYVYGTKGGVGKTTLSINIAQALANKSKKVVLVDMDISGPNIHTLLGDPDVEMFLEDFLIRPAQYGNLHVVSTGLIFSSKEISFFSGKYLEGLLHQMLLDNHWDCDHIVIDMPPGFGDIHRILFGNYPGDVLLVTTPQKTSYDNLKRGVAHLKKLDINIIGVIENMAYLQCKSCHKITNFQIQNQQLPIPTFKLPFDTDFLSKEPTTMSSFFVENTQSSKEFEELISMLEDENAG